MVARWAGKWGRGLKCASWTSVGAPVPVLSYYLSNTVQFYGEIHHGSPWNSFDQWIISLKLYPDLVTLTMADTWITFPFHSYPHPQADLSPTHQLERLQAYLSSHEEELRRAERESIMATYKELPALRRLCYEYCARRDGPYRFSYTTIAHKSKYDVLTLKYNEDARTAVQHDPDFGWDVCLLGWAIWGQDGSVQGADMWTIGESH